MIRSLRFLPFVMIVSLSLGFVASAFAQSHGISSQNFLSAGNSAKGVHAEKLGLVDKAHLLDKNAASVAGALVQGEGKALALRNGFATDGAQRGVGQQMPLKNKVTVDRHPGARSWSSAFDGIAVKQGSSKGKLPADAAQLQNSSTSKHFSDNSSSHRMATPWSKLSKDDEGLK